MKKVHRLVVLPDFQGIGIGTKFLTKVSHFLTIQGYKIGITTSQPGLVQALPKHGWKLNRKGRMSSITGNSGIKRLKTSSSRKRLTATLVYEPPCNSSRPRFI